MQRVHLQTGNDLTKSRAANWCRPDCLDLLQGHWERRTGAGASAWPQADTRTGNGRCLLQRAPRVLRGGPATRRSSPQQPRRPPPSPFNGACRRNTDDMASHVRGASCLNATPDCAMSLGGYQIGCM